MESLSAPPATKSLRRAAWSEQRTCPQCGTPFTATSKKPTKKFCCRTCFDHSPQKREKCSQNMRREMLSPTSALRRAAIIRAHCNNPSRRAKVRAKISAALKGRPFPALRGGNGHDLTEPQKYLLEALGVGWEAEYVIGLPAELRGAEGAERAERAKGTIAQGVHGCLTAGGPPRPTRRPVKDCVSA